MRHALDDFVIRDAKPYGVWDDLRPSWVRGEFFYWRGHNGTVQHAHIPAGGMLCAATALATAPRYCRGNPYGLATHVHHLRRRHGFPVRTHYFTDAVTNRSFGVYAITTKVWRMSDAYPEDFFVWRNNDRC